MVLVDCVRIRGRPMQERSEHGLMKWRISMAVSQGTAPKELRDLDQMEFEPSFRRRPKSRELLHWFPVPAPASGWDPGTGAGLMRS